MEYTKDIILNLNYKEKLNTSKIKLWTSNLKKRVKSNKLIVATLVILTTLVSIDILLINSFLNFLSKLY